MAHGKVHERFDKLEDSYMVDNPATGKKTTGQWPFETANKSACQTIEVVTGCNGSCIEENSKQEHEKMGIQSDTQLRANSTGKSTPDNSVQRTQSDSFDD